VLGRIVTGDHTGRFVEDVDDAVSSGGFLILTYDNADRSGDGYDWWAESRTDVVLSCDESGWDVGVARLTRRRVCRGGSSPVRRCPACS
jgi:hypothetical protein